MLRTTMLEGHSRDRTMSDLNLRSNAASSALVVYLAALGSKLVNPEDDPRYRSCVQALHKW
ncbi:hypothetical protein NLM27_27160 [Bradyrhizobium sp. CCGB12]|uniref:hypothetical protein n=1 Tax=Bradyrhizobium sp. CCGB12 TaxID=2949632 RepID=UPI0020B2B144|nr:hypothetical protein [Bradyrhizobium sp. CCGB12]MCP3392430.1 hypothetical protein [Bradyrhizobium sp. CCGB12]